MAQVAVDYTDQEYICKSLYKAIVKMLQPEDDLGANVYDISLFSKANDCFKTKNYKGLENIYDTLMNPQPIKTAEMPVPAKTLYEFFSQKGLEVIDKRDRGGCLWVVGSPNEISSIVNEACSLFCAGGHFAMNGGRSTGYRTAWFTQCAR